MSHSSFTALVSPEWLSEHLSDSDVVVLDASFFLPNQNRNARAEFDAAHLPGADFFDIDEVADHTTALPHMLPNPDAFATTVSTLGIDSQTHVIAYDSNYFMASARLWWTFRVFGHERVSVLDGGLEAWKAKALPLVSEIGKRSPKPFRATFRPELVVDLATVRTRIDSESHQILDARSPGRFWGRDPEPRPGLRSGHIPGSSNLFFKDLVDPTSLRMKSKDELSGLFTDAGLARGKAVITTCGTGVTAAILALGLYRLGNDRVAVYDGSWSEWGARTDTPVATS